MSIIRALGKLFTNTKEHEDAPTMKSISIEQLQPGSEAYLVEKAVNTKDKMHANYFPAARDIDGLIAYKGDASLDECVSSILENYIGSTKDSSIPYLLNNCARGMLDDWAPEKQELIEICLVNSLDVVKNTHGAFHIIAGIAANNLAINFAYAGDYQQALSLAQTAMRVKAKLMDDGAVTNMGTYSREDLITSIAITMNNYGVMLIRLKKYSEGADTISAAYSQLEDMHFYDHDTVAKNYALALMTTGCKEKAQAVLSSIGNEK